MNTITSKREDISPPPLLSQLTPLKPTLPLAPELPSFPPPLPSNNINKKDKPEGEMSDYLYDSLVEEERYFLQLPLPPTPPSFH